MSSCFDIRGISVTFPCEPYEIQKEYMGKVIESLQNETNAILESPTGTGKTLSLLCSTLAWLTIKKAQIQAQRYTNADEADENFLSTWNKDLNAAAGKPGKHIDTPMIIYASRTHSQLAQAMQELKRTAYRDMKAIVLGSREQLCINSEVMNEPNPALKVHLCRRKVQTRSCSYYNKVNKFKDSSVIQDMNVVDIEDLVKAGTTHKFCPYFMSKEIKSHADIVFMPYNYLLNPRARKAQGVELRNNIVILDEGHNIEKMCEDAASLQLRTTDITSCIEEVAEVMKALSSDSIATFNDVPKDFDVDELCTFKQMFLDLKKTIDGIPIKPQPEMTTFQGDYIFDILASAQITRKNQASVLAMAEKLLQFQASNLDGPFQRKGNGLQLFADFLQAVFVNNSPDLRIKIKQCYKIHLAMEEPKKWAPNNWRSKATSNAKGCRVLSYWCFSPGFGMDLLMEQGLRSLILTSGTLAPIKPLLSELRLNVQIQLENPHIVKSDQVCVAIVPTGPDGETLNCNYHNRDNPKYLTSLGLAILNLSRIIPNGLLIFFPSYPIMHKCVEYWQGQGIWTSICNVKPIFIEPKEQKAFSVAMSEYYSKIRDPMLKGAIFMGVCRGKVSEGLDFADANGRAVIITGIPFLAFNHPRIVLKRKYLDSCRSSNKDVVSSDVWYTLEATRAVNQAIGRIIRHQHDYGAILLLDSRFNSERIKSKLSMWLRNQVISINSFGQVIGLVSSFFRAAKTNHPAMETPKSIEEAPLTQASGGSRKRGKFDFSTTSACSSKSGSLVNIHKRESRVALSNVSKRKKSLVVKNPENKSSSLEKDSRKYIAWVKKMLNQEFRMFSDALQSYRRDNDFSKLVEHLDRIFIKRRDATNLIKGLGPYIQEEHRSSFQSYWKKLR